MLTLSEERLIARRELSLQKRRRDSVHLLIRRLRTGFPANTSVSCDAVSLVPDWFMQHQRGSEPPRHRFQVWRPEDRGADGRAVHPCPNIGDKEWLRKFLLDNWVPAALKRWP